MSGLAKAAASHLLRRLRSARGEEGSISPLIIGFAAVALMLVLLVVDMTALHLARVRLLDECDAAAADAADAMHDPAYYGKGAGDGPRLDDAGVEAAAGHHLAAQPLPGNVLAWSLAPGTPDGRTAVVRITGDVRIPIVTPVVSAFGGSVRITVESRAQSRVR